MGKILSILGGALAHEIGKEEAMCRGLLRLTITEIAEQVKSLREPAEIQAYIESMKFEDWETLIKDENFIRRLRNIGVQQPDRVAQYLRETLIQNQSLIVLSAH